MSDAQENRVSVNSHVRRTRSLWRNRDYLLLWGGQIVSLTGTGISQLAFPLLVLALTGSPAQAGFVGALRGLPFLLLSLPAGALVDRWNRKKVMMLCDIGRAIALGSIPLAYVLGHLTMAQLYSAALIEGTLFTFFNLAETASLPNVVPEDQLAAAAAQNETASNLTYLISPLLGGALYGVGKALPFLTDALSYVLSVCSLGLIRASFQQARSDAPLTIWTDIRAGFRWLWHQPLISYLSLLTGCINMIALSSELTVIVLAQEQHVAPVLIGLMFTIGGIGGSVGALLSTPIQRKFRFGTTTIAICWLLALFWSLYALAFHPLLLTIIFTAIAFVGPIFNVMQFSFRVTLIPDELQGRVNSVFRLVAFSLQALGLALTGILLQRLGPLATILLFSMFLLVLAIATTLNPHVRKSNQQNAIQ